MMKSKEDGEDDSESGATTSSGRSTDSQTINGSLVEYYGQGVSYCGYCKLDESRAEGRRSHDMKAYKLQAEDYQGLLDRGWRRSGTYCYHPTNKTTCCPNYSISCKAINFKFSRSHRRCVERMNSFLINGTPDTKVKLKYDNVYARQETRAIRSFEELKASSKSRDRRFVRSCERKVRLHGMTLDDAIQSVRARNRSGLYFRPLLENYLYPRIGGASSGDDGAVIEAKHQLEIKLQHVESEESIALRDEEFDVMRKYQTTIHKEDESEWSRDRYCDFLVNSPLIVEPLTHRKYLTAADRDKKTALGTDFHENEYENLLVKPPELPACYGTYHCIYVLDKKLIGVGVLDILPKCITTVYFFYDPLYEHLKLGIYSALVEISMIRRMAMQYTGPPEDNRLIHYYVGFYVHECKKMRYKTKFLPSYLLCSETYEYVPTDVCLRKLETVKYARFSSSNLGETDETFDYKAAIDCCHIPVLAPVIDSPLMVLYLNWIALNLGPGYGEILVKKFLIPYCQLVGSKLARKLTLRVDSVHRALVNKYQSQ